MERIQSAIDKARARRSEDVSPPEHISRRQTADPSAFPQAATRTRVDAAWAALPAFRPDPAHLSRGRIVAYAPGIAAIPFDVMRTKLLYQMRDKNWRRVAITSPGVGCGKTMTTINLAFSLSRQSDVRSMLIELDLRRPSMAQVLGLETQQQFSRVLQGTAQAEDNLLRHGTNLAFATNNIPATNPAELLQGISSAAVIDAIEATYAPDVTLFDMPPMLVSDDTIAFLDQVDCCLLMGAAETTTLEEIDKCSQEISSRTNLLGVVLNKCRFMEGAVDYAY